MSLKDKVIVVTGASRGLGKSLCLALGKEGVIVVAAARKLDGPRSAGETAGLVVAQGGKALPVQCDIGVPDQVEALMDTAIRQLGRIDGLVNNAGVLIYGSILELTVEDWNTTMSANLTGPFLCCKYALPNMIERRQGSIVNVSSTLAGRYKENNLAYGPSKAALDRFTLNLAGDMKQYNIAVNSLCPGRLATEMIDTRFRPADPPEFGVSPILWMLQQDAFTFTGQMIERKDFGITYGPGIATKKE